VEKFLKELIDLRVMTTRRYLETGLMVVPILTALSLSWALPALSTRAEDRPISSTLTPAPAPQAVQEPSTRAAFSIRYKDVESPFTTSSALVMPGEELSFEAVAQDPNDSFEAQASSGTLLQTGVGRWSWKAPTLPGIYPVVVRNSLKSSITLEGLVMMPHRASRSSINGYPIGSYPKKPFKNNPIYLPPKGLVEVTEANKDVFLTPHFQLGQFVCKQRTTFPKYLVVNERLLLKLEMIVEELNRLGHSVSSLHVMSGYRTPAYNAYLKNVRYSTHQFGYAADIFVDENPRDGIMDDLNGDGRINRQDAEVVTSIVAGMDQSERYRELLGGLGGYSTDKWHGPFVHVDVRGWDARWGLQPRRTAAMTVQRVAMR